MFTGYAPVCLYFHGCGESFSGLFKSSECLKVNEMPRLSNYIKQLLMVEGQLWALMNDQIQILAPDGSVVKKLFFGLSKATDMCLVGRHVFVSDEEGLIRKWIDVTSELLDEGTYWSVTSCADYQSIWAVKQEGDTDSKLWICKFHVHSDEPLLKLQTTIKTGAPYHCSYCAVLGRQLYLSHEYDNCIYCIDTFTGATLSVHGSEGEKGPPGMLYGARTVYSDETSRCLLVVDEYNNRLQVFDTVTNSWSIVKTTEALKYVTAVTVDDENNVWVGAAHLPIFLYKCTL